MCWPNHHLDAIHDQARPDIVLRNLYNALRTDGGVYLMQDIRAASDVEEPVRDMLLVCERFRVVYQSSKLISI